MSPMWMGILRHALTTAGGALVANGTISDGELQTGVGAVIAIVGLAWSIWEKRRAVPAS
jgi:hypothetical protein